MASIKIKASFAPPVSSLVNVEDEGALIVSTQDLNFVGAGVTVTENPAGTAEILIPSGSVQFWTESESAATQQNTRWIPNNAATNVVAVISPKGNGANTAQRPDGTAIGGNARGNFATDWQKNRTANTQVASGTESVISGGHQNTASGNHATVSGGNNNLSSGNHATIAGGQNHTASGNHGTVSGGRLGSAVGAFSTVVGGVSNSATGDTSIAGGDQTGATAVSAICLGSESTASGSRSTVLGRQNQATAASSTAIGLGNRVEGIASFASGAGGLIKNARQRAFSQSFNASGSADIANFSGRAQEGCVVLGFNSRLTGIGQPPTLITTGQVFYLSLGNAGLTNPAGVGWLPATSNQQFTFQLKLFATITAITGTATGIAVGDVKQWNIEGSGKNVANTATILNATTTPVVLYEDAGLATFSAQFIEVAGKVVVEITAPTFAGGGSLELMVNGFMYYQEAALN